MRFKIKKSESRCGCGCGQKLNRSGYSSRSIKFQKTWFVLRMWFNQKCDTIYNFVSLEVYPQVWLDIGKLCGLLVIVR